MSTPARRQRIIFITGTDTGVGKTVLTGLLLCHLRRSRPRALAIKPFASGSYADSKLLQALQDSELTLRQITPFFFRQPLAPLAASRRRRRNIPIGAALERVRAILTAQPASCAGEAFLLIEGVGGLLVPLGAGYTVLDLILGIARQARRRRGTSCEVLVVAPNRLGTLNHTLLTVRALREAGVRHARVVLMDCPKPDLSAASNPSLLAELAAPCLLHRVPHLGRNGSAVAAIRRNSARLAGKLDRLVS